jgi:hypothetical protein
MVPVAALAVAERVTTVPLAMVAPGETRTMVGARPPETLTVMADEVVVPPTLSVATAVRV